MTITPERRRWLAERLREIAAEAAHNERIAAEFRRVAEEVENGHSPREGDIR